MEQTTPQGTTTTAPSTIFFLDDDDSGKQVIALTEEGTAGEVKIATDISAFSNFQVTSSATTTDLVYKGSEFTATDLTVAHTLENGTILTLGTHFTFEIATDIKDLPENTTTDNTNASISGQQTGNTTGRVKIAGIGDYAGTTYANFTITPKPLTKDMLADFNQATYNGTSQTPTETVTDGTELTKGTDYEVAWEYKAPSATDFTAVTSSEFKNAGTYKAIVTGKGNYATPDSGALSKDYVISPKELKITPKPNQTKVYGDKEPTFDSANFNYVGEIGEEIPAFTGALARAAGEDVKTEGYAFNLGDLTIIDYTDGKFIAANYTLALAADSPVFTIGKKPLTKDMIVDFATTTYDGTSQASTVTVTDGGITLA